MSRANPFVPIGQVRVSSGTLQQRVVKGVLGGVSFADNRFPLGGKPRDVLQEQDIHIKLQTSLLIQNLDPPLISMKRWHLLGSTFLKVSYADLKGVRREDRFQPRHFGIRSFVGPQRDSGVLLGGKEGCQAHNVVIQTTALPNTVLIQHAFLRLGVILGTNELH